MADGSQQLVARPYIVTDPSPVHHYLTKFESLKTERLDFDRKWQLVSDYQLPRRDFTVSLRPNQLRPHRVTSSVATALGMRLASNLLASIVDHTQPFVLPSVKRGMAMAGRSVDLDDDAINYVGQIAWSVFDRMLLPRAHLMERLGAMLLEFVFFGCGVIFTGRRRGFGPVYTGRPLQACWWSENEWGEIDTLYFRVQLPIHRIIERWPVAASIPGWDKEAKEQNQQALSHVLICVEPRLGGRYGAVAEAKPFKYVCVSEEKKVVLENSGYDSFPYSVFRMNAFSGAAYAEGCGVHAIADVMVINHLQQAIENIAEQKANPPLAWPARMFPKPLDRRPGAPNAYNPAGLGIQRADQAILKLDFTGDPTQALKMLEMLYESVGKTFFDWMTKQRETGDMTAEEVVEGRGLRVDGLGSITANCDQPMTVLGDRTLEGLIEEGMLPGGMPGSLKGVNVDWEYWGPLKRAQMQRIVQATMQLIQARGLVAAQDPAAAHAIDLETSLRTIQGSLGTPMGTVNSKAAVADAREQQARQQIQQANAAKLAAVASAAKDAGAGAASAASAHVAMNPAGPGPGGPAPGPGAPFGPASPLTQPLAA